MSKTKFEHVIGRDGLNRLRLTAANGEIIDNSHEGFDEESGALRNLRLKLCAYLVLGGLPQVYAENIANTAVNNIYRDGYSTVDEREPDVACVPHLEREPEADPLRRETVFGKPAADPLEPQTPEN